MARPTNKQKLGQKISKAKREELLPALSKLKDAASRGERPKKQYEFAGISEATYYRWLKETPKLQEELTQLLTDYRMAKIKEAALIGAPVAEQQYHANKMTELEYNELMKAHPDFFEDIVKTQHNALKLWSRKNIAESIQTKGNITDSWRYLEHMDEEMNKTKLEITDNAEDTEDNALLDEYEEKLRGNIKDRIKKLAKKQ